MTSSYVDVFTKGKKKKKLHSTLFTSKGPKVLETPEEGVWGQELEEVTICFQPLNQALLDTHVLRELPAPVLPPPHPQPAWVWVRPWRPRGKEVL